MTTLPAKASAESCHSRFKCWPQGYYQFSVVLVIINLLHVIPHPRQESLLDQVGLEEQLGTPHPEHAQAHQPHHHSVRHDALRPSLLPQEYPYYHTVYQSYRNLSRTLKQYFYGDRDAENFLVLELRNQFHMPYKC